MIGKILSNRYKLLELVGEGGMATIYRAEDTRLKRIVAIKVLSEKLARDKEILSRFIREAQSAARLVHPNIINIFDIGESDGINFIVMEYLEAKNLKDIIEENAPYSPTVSFRIFKQVAEALKFAHENGIIHRDIKPQNVLVTGNGVFKVTDFGIARAITSSTLTRTGTMMGSVQYFSPEQAQGKPVDRTTDIYSLGILLFEILTGKLPFDGDNPVSIALKQVQEESPPPSALNRHLTPEIDQLVLKALCKDPGERYQDIDEFIAAAEKVLSDGTGQPEKKPVASHSLSEQKTTAVKKKEIPVFENNEKPVTAKGVSEIEKYEADTKKGMPVFIILLMISLVIITVTLYKRGELGLMLNKDVVPDLEGLTLAQAREKVDKRGWQIQIEEEIYHTKVPEGIIINQRPFRGEKLPRGSNIFVSISMGKPRIEVPQLVGLKLSDAKTLLDEKKLGWIVQDTVYSETIPKDVVVSQDPKPEEEAAPGRKVFLTISLGSEKMEVPNLVGMPKSQAEGIASKKSLTVVVEKEESSTQYPSGHIISQEPAPGTKVDRGTNITVVVSKGTEVITAPDLVGKTLGEAIGLLDNMKIKLEVTDGSTDKSLIIEGQSPASGSRMESKVLKVWCQRKTIVPNLIGKNLEDAQNRIYKLGLKIRIKYVESNMRSGVVLEQNPPNGSLVEKGRQVVITVSKKTIPIPVETSSPPPVVKASPTGGPGDGVIIVPVDTPHPLPSGLNDGNE